MNVTVKVHTGEVRSLLNSDGVVGELQGHCDAAAERCNALVEWHSPMNAPAFVGEVDHGRYAAVGKVRMVRTGHPRQDHMATAMYEAKHKVLLKGCGW